MAGIFPAIDDIPEFIRLKEPLLQDHLLIDGQLKKWDGAVHRVNSPVYTCQKDTGLCEPVHIGSYPQGGVREAEEALHAAQRAFDHGRGSWPAMPMQDRIEHLERFLEKMKGLRGEIVRLILWETGKTMPDAGKEFDRTVEYIQATIAAAAQLNNKHIRLQLSDEFIGQTKKVPFGVTLCMGPSNYPLNGTFTILIPALIMGNTILLQPPEQGALLFAPLLAAFAECFPKGAVNTFYGRSPDVISFLMQSGKVDVLALTGSSNAADRLKKMHPRSSRLKSVLRLEAKNAAIILSDADVLHAVRECVAGALSFNGQRSTALQLFFVHRPVVNQFNELLTQAVNRLDIGMPWMKQVSITPLAEPSKPLYLSELITDAVEKGASVLNYAEHGDAIYHSMVRPTVLYPIGNRMRIYHEAQLGPLIPVVPFDDVSLPIDYVTNSPYGQQVSIFSEDAEAMSYLIDQLNGQVGRININSQCQRSPDSFAFGGRKDSAEGTQSVSESLLAFSTDSVVATRRNPANRRLFEDILMDGSSARLNSDLAVVTEQPAGLP